MIKLLGKNNDLRMAISTLSGVFVFLNGRAAYIRSHK